MAHPGTSRITVGIDTHLDLHVAHACDQLGRRIDTVQVPTTPAGYRDLLAWARGLGQPVAWGVEGTGSYGAALARFLTANGQAVLEVNRPDRQARRRHGKSDPLDAQAARPGRAGRPGHGRAQGRRRPGSDDPLPAGRPRHRDAGPHPGDQRAQSPAGHRPAELREQLRGLPATTLVRSAAQLDPGPIASPLAAAMLALRTLAGRHQALSAEITTLTTELDRLTTRAAPQLVALFGVGQDSAGALLVAAGDNPDRLHSEAAFSMLCGSSPIQASSGKTTRHRLNRGGDRQANAALYRIVLVRLCYDQATREYMARRTKQGKSKKEIIRCLKRYVAREVFAVLHDMRTTDSTTAA
jgi:transposase